MALNSAESSEPAICLNALSYYLLRIKLFVENKKKKSLVFPSISTELQDVLIKIAKEGPQFLLSEDFNEIVKTEAQSLQSMLDAYRYLRIVPDFKEGEYGSKVLMYSKVDMSMISPTGSPPPLRKPNTVQTSTVMMETPSDSLVTPIFKTLCLNSSTKFVKDDTQLVKKYPPLAPAQADFLIKMLTRGKEDKSEEMDVGYGYRSMYAPLLEAMRVFALKYSYVIQDEVVPGDHPKKRVIFEKVPKFKIPLIPEERKMVSAPSVMETAPILKAPTKQNDTSTTDIDDSCSTTSRASSNSSSRRNRNKRKTSKQEKKCQAKEAKELKRISMLRKKLGSVSGQFIRTALQKMANFLEAEDEASLIFPKNHNAEAYFLRKIQRTSKDEKCYMLFDSECQLYLQTIRYWLDRSELLLKEFSLRKAGQRDIHFIKKARFPPKQVTEKPCNKECKPPTPLSKSDQDLLIYYKSIKDMVSLSSGDTYIPTILQDINNFLTSNRMKKCLSFEQCTEEQELLLKNVHVWSKLDMVYPMFDQTCQELLKCIRVNAERYDLRYYTHEWYNDDGTQMFVDVTIKKTLTTVPAVNVPKQYEKSSQIKAYTNAGTSGTKLSGKDKLMAGLQQPVQSDKALRMMQGMGWKGGALGIRGHGITEPIMPALDFVTRAGLGHVPKKPTPKPQKTQTKKVIKKVQNKENKVQNGAKAVQNKVCKGAPVPDLFSKVLPLESLPKNLLPPGIVPSGQKTVSFFPKKHGRATVLSAVLELIVSDKLDSIKFIYMTTSQNKKKLCGNNFIQELVVAFNKRKKVLGMVGPEQLETLNCILSELIANPALTFTFEPITDKTCVVRKFIDLTKIKTNDKNNNAKTKKNSRIIDSIDLTLDDTADEDSIQHDSYKHITKAANKTKEKININKLNNESSKTNAKISNTYLKMTDFMVVNETNSKTANMSDGTNYTAPQTTKSDELNIQPASKTTDSNDTIKTISKTMKSVDFISHTPANINGSSDPEINVDHKDCEKENTADTSKAKSTVVSTDVIGQLNSNETVNQSENTDDKGKAISDVTRLIEAKMYLESDPNESIDDGSTDISETSTNISEACTKKAIDNSCSLESMKITNTNMDIVNDNTNIANNETNIVINSNDNKNLPNEILNKIDNCIANDNIHTNNSDNTNMDISSANIAESSEMVIDIITNISAKVNIDTDSNNVGSDCTKMNLNDRNTDINNVISELSDSTVTNTQNVDTHGSEQYNKKIITEKINDFNVNSVEKSMATDRNYRNDKINDNLQVNSNNIVDKKLNSNGQDADCLENHKDSEWINNKIINNQVKDDTDELSEYEKDFIIMNNDIDIVELNSSAEELLMFSDDESVSKVKSVNPSNSKESFDSNNLNLENGDVSVKIERDNLDSGFNQEYIIPTKRHSTDSTDCQKKKQKLLADYKKLCIVHKDISIKITKEKAREIQSEILNSIDYGNELPLLSCEGIQNGGLVYSCQDEKSVAFMEKIVKQIDLNILYEFDAKKSLVHKMAFKMNSFLEEDVRKILTRLELYNIGLDASQWEVIKKEQYGEFVVIFVEIDDGSFHFICNSNFILYAGNDCAKFTIVWN